MPRSIYTVEIDGREFDIEGDRPPSEAEARAAVGAQPTATPPPADATRGMLAPETEATPPSLRDQIRQQIDDYQRHADTRSAEMTADMKAHPVRFAANVGLVAAAPAILSRVPGILGRGAGMVSRAMAGKPAVAGAVYGGAEGAIESKGNPSTIAKRALSGALMGALLGGRRSRAAEPTPEAPPSPSAIAKGMARTDEIIADELAKGAARRAPQATPAAPVAGPVTTPAASLRQELLDRLRHVDFDEQDVVSISAMKPDSLGRRKTVAKIVESTPELKRMHRRAVTAGDKATVTQLEKEIRQRFHVTDRP